MDCKEGAPGFMANLYLYKITVYGSVYQGKIGLQTINTKDVYTVPGCIHRVLRSTLRYPSQVSFFLNHFRKSF